ncbi:MAG: hypothetical protein WC869_05310 [Phycisphaerae bacterium]|jgi:hypothetical protein
MKLIKGLVWVVGGTLAGLVVAAAVLYWLAGATPEQYRPPSLTSEQRNVAAKQFYHKAMDFDDGVQANAPFEWSLSAEQLNQYLSSVDEIAALLPDGQPGEVRELMQSSGLSEPMVVLGDGCMTLMIYSRRHGKVVSADVVMSMDEQKNLRIRLSQVRVGKVAMPEDLITGQLGEFKRKLLAQKAARQGRSQGVANSPAGQLAASAGSNLIDTMIAAIDGQSFEPVSRLKGRMVHLESLTITPGQLTLGIRPELAPRSARHGSSARSSTQSPATSSFPVDSTAPAAR